MTPFDTRGEFMTAQRADVSRLAVRGAGFTVFSSGVNLLVQVLATVVLGRLLRPDDFGVVAMVTTFSLLVTNFGLNGFTEAVVQRPTLNHQLASTLFWINLGAGSALSVAFAASGGLLARFYGDRRVALVAAAMSLTVFATSTSVLHLALLKRAMLFGMLSLNDIVARAASVVIAISFGLLGWGYWALVAGAIAIPIMTSIGAWWGCRWMPGSPRGTAGAGSMVRFAMHTYGRFAVNYLTRNIDNILVGWRYSGAALGYYKKAYDLFALSASQLISPLTVVAVSALRTLIDDLDAYKRYFLRALGVVAFIGMFLAGYLTLIGADLVRLLLGPGWDAAGRIFTCFGPGIGMMLIAGTHAWIHLSLGKPDRWLRWGIWEVVITILLFIVGLRWGPAGIATAWTLSFWLLGIPSLWYAGRPIRLSATQITGVIWRYGVAALVAGVASASLLQRSQSVLQMPGAPGAVARIGYATTVFSGGYIASVYLLYGGAEPIREVVQILRKMVPSLSLRREPPESKADRRLQPVQPGTTA